MRILMILAGSLLFSPLVQSMQIGLNKSPINHNLLLKVEALGQASENYFTLQEQSLKDFLKATGPYIIKFSSEDFFVHFSFEDNQVAFYSAKNKEVYPFHLNMKIEMRERDAEANFRKRYKLNGVIKDEELALDLLRNNIASHYYEQLGFAEWARRICLSLPDHQPATIQKALSLYCAYFLSLVFLQEEQGEVIRIRVNDIGEYLSLLIGFFYNIGGVSANELKQAMLVLQTSFKLSTDENQVLKKFQAVRNLQGDEWINPTMVYPSNLPLSDQIKIQKSDKIGNWNYSCLHAANLPALKQFRILKNCFEHEEDKAIAEAIDFNIEVFLSQSYGTISPRLRHYGESSLTANCALYAAKIKLLEEILATKKSLVENPQLLWKFMLNAEFTRLFDKLFTPSVPADEDKMLQMAEKLIQNKDFKLATSYILPLIASTKKESANQHRALDLLTKASNGFFDLVQQVIKSETNLPSPCIAVLIHLKLMKGEIGNHAGALLKQLLALMGKKLSSGLCFKPDTYSIVNLLTIIDDDLKESVAEIFQRLPTRLLPIGISTDYFIDQVRDEFILVTQKKIKSDGPLNLNVELTTEALNYLKTIDGCQEQAQSLLDAMNARL